MSTNHILNVITSVEVSIKVLFKNFTIAGRNE